MALGRDILKPIVFDNGCELTKVGFAGDDVPCSVFDTVVGHIKHKDLKREGYKETYVGNEAFANRPLVWIRRPIECCIINKWEEMEKLWDHSFSKELCVAPELHPVILTEPLLNPKSNRERMAEIMFEGFRVPAMYAILQSVASLYSSGHTTGIVVECEHDASYTVPIYEGYAIPHAISRLALGGFHVTYDGIYHEECCYPTRKITMKKVTLAEECPSAISAAFEWTPDNIYTRRSNSFHCPELLFQPSLIGMESPAIQELANNSIIKCDVDIRKRLYETIVLRGRATMFPGFAPRFRQEISALAPNDVEVAVIAPEDRVYSAWRGASILASLDTFQQMWITKADYNENGPRIINWKCF